MKVSKFLGTLMLSTIALTAAASMASAETTVFKEDLNKTNEMQVEITTGTDVKPPVDPTKPTIEDPDKIKGVIGISKVSPLFFQQVKLSGQAVTTAAQFYEKDENGKYKPTTQEMKDTYATDDEFPAGVFTPSMVVVDARGTGEGWKVEAAASELKAGEEVMKGAKLTFNSPIITTTEDNAAVLEGNYPTADTAVSVAAGGTAETVLTAAKDVKQGMGTYYVRYMPKKMTIAGKEFKNSPVQLTVPASTKIGNYTGTITYTMKPEGAIKQAD